MCCIFIVKIKSTIIFIYICISTYNGHIPIHIHVRVHIHIHTHIQIHMWAALYIYIYIIKRKRERERGRKTTSWCRIFKATTSINIPTPRLPVAPFHAMTRLTCHPRKSCFSKEIWLVLHGVTIIDCAKDGGYPSTDLQNQCNKWWKKVEKCWKVWAWSSVKGGSASKRPPKTPPLLWSQWNVEIPWNSQQKTMGSLNLGV